MMEAWAANNIEFIRQKVKEVMTENEWLKKCLDGDFRAREFNALKEELESLKKEIADAPVIYAAYDPSLSGPVIWCEQPWEDSKTSAKLMRRVRIDGR